MSEKICEECAEGELVQASWSPDFLICEKCGKPMHKADLEDLEALREDAGRNSEIRQCFWATVNRPRASGGGDDGLALTDDVPIGDETIVSVISHKDGKVLKVSTIEATAEETRRALAAWFENPPDEAELASLLAEFKADRAKVRKRR